MVWFGVFRHLRRYRVRPVERRRKPTGCRWETQGAMFMLLLGEDEVGDSYETLKWGSLIIINHLFKIGIFHDFMIIQLLG